MTLKRIRTKVLQEVMLTNPSLKAGVSQVIYNWVLASGLIYLD